jgi:hypothetical protein
VGRHLWREDAYVVYNRQRYHSRARAMAGLMATHFLVSQMRGSPQPGGPCTYIPKEHSGLVMMPPGKFKFKLYSYCDRRSVGQFVLGGAHDQILIFFVWQLLSSFCRAPSPISPLNRVVQPALSQSHVSIRRNFLMLPLGGLFTLYVYNFIVSSSLFKYFDFVVFPCLLPCILRFFNYISDLKFLTDFFLLILSGN